MSRLTKLDTRPTCGELMQHVHESLYGDDAPLANPPPEWYRPSGVRKEMVGRRLDARLAYVLTLRLRRAAEMVQDLKRDLSGLQRDEADLELHRVLQVLLEDSSKLQFDDDPGVFLDAMEEAE